MTQWVKDPALSLLWLELLLWYGFSPWPGSFYAPQTWPKKKQFLVLKKKKKKKKFQGIS